MSLKLLMSKLAPGYWRYFKNNDYIGVYTGMHGAIFKSNRRLRPSSVNFRAAALLPELLELLAHLDERRAELPEGTEEKMDIILGRVEHICLALENEQRRSDSRGRSRI